MKLPKIYYLCPLPIKFSKNGIVDLEEGASLHSDPCKLRDEAALIDGKYCPILHGMFNYPEPVECTEVKMELRKRLFPKPIGEQ